MANVLRKKRKGTGGLPLHLLPKKTLLENPRAKMVSHLVHCTVDLMRQGLDPTQTLDHELHVALNAESRRLRMYLTMPEYCLAVKFTLQIYNAPRYTEDPQRGYNPAIEYELFLKRK